MAWYGKAFQYIFFDFCWISIYVQVESLIKELASAGSDALGIQLDEGTIPRLCAYAKSVSHYPTAVKEVRIKHKNTAPSNLYCLQFVFFFMMETISDKQNNKRKNFALFLLPRLSTEGFRIALNEGIPLLQMY